MANLKLRAGKVQLNSMSALVRAIKASAQPQLIAYANRLGRNGVQMITAEARSIYNTGRPTSRRSHPGSMRLGSGAMFDYNVTAYRSGDAQTTFLVKGGGNEMAKFMTLNFGGGSHQINPVKGAGLAFPRGTDGSNAINTTKGASLEGVFITGGRGRQPGVMWSPGGKIGTHFFEKGIAKARRITR